MTDEPPLELEIQRLVRLAGPMSVADYMTLCLTHPRHGYYVTRDPFGTAGDFITAPEISQMFGEILGLWAAATWRLIGAPENVRLVELGPGRGTMMRDMLRAARVVPDFHAAIVAHLVEISPVLEGHQREALAGLDVPTNWHRALAEVPPGPMILVANEYIDALPVHQAIKRDDGWYERAVDVDDVGNLIFATSRTPIARFEQAVPQAIRDAAPGAIFEWRPDNHALEIGHRMVTARGAALLIDYGHAASAVGDTFQAVGAHSFADPLSTPGLVDLTAHVDFAAIAQAAESIGARAHGPVDQADFLLRLGIESRANALRRQASAAQALDIDAALARLTSREQGGMGALFKVLAITHPAFDGVPGFD